MRLLTKKQFQGEIEKATEPLKLENEKLRDIINKKEFRYLSKVDKLEKENEEYKSIIMTEERYIKELNQKINKLTEDKKLYFGAKGGLTKQVNKLQKLLDEANEKLSQRYILKELAPQKSKNTQVMKTKSSSKTSKIIKKVVEDE